MNQFTLRFTSRAKRSSACVRPPFLERLEDRALLSSGLIGYWPFDGTGGDASGYARDMDLKGGVGFASGLFGSALDLHKNANQYAQRPVDDPAFDFGSSNFTVQVWVNFNTTVTEETLFEKFQGGSGPGWTLGKIENGNPNGSKAWHFYANPSAKLYSGAQDPLTQVWHQVVVRRNGNTFNLFANGAIVATAANANPIPDTTKPLLAGRRDGGQQFPVDGRLDEFAIWNRALKNCEINNLYNAGAGRPADSATGICVNDGLGSGAEHPTVHAWTPPSPAPPAPDPRASISTSFIVTAQRPQQSLGLNSPTCQRARPKEPDRAR